MAMTESQKKYEKKRMQDCKTYTTKYRLYLDNEKNEQQRLEKYLEQTGQSANSYIKSLIKADLDSKGFSVDNTTDMDTNTDSTDIP